MPGFGELLKNGLQGAVTGVLDGASKVIGSFIADPTKKAEALAEIEKLKIEAATKSEELANALELARIEELKNEDNNVSDRWKSDMTSDNKLSKNTRPIIVLSLLAFLFIIIITDSAVKEGFEVKKEYVDLMSTLLMTVMVAYFGSRGIEKYKALHEMKNN